MVRIDLNQSLKLRDAIARTNGAAMGATGIGMQRCVAAGGRTTESAKGDFTATGVRKEQLLMGKPWNSPDARFATRRPTISWLGRSWFAIWPRT